MRRVIIIPTAVLLVAVVSCNAQPEQDSDPVVGSWTSGGGGGHWNPEGWRRTSTCHEIEGFGKRPEANIEYRCEVEESKLGVLGNIWTVRGRLLYRTDENEKYMPVNWFQGITVYLANQPDIQQDWSAGVDQDQTSDDTTYLENSGRFSVQFDLRETKRDSALSQNFQIGIALAKHDYLGDKKGRNQRVTWKSSFPALANTIDMIEIPQSKKLAKELRLIDQACKWPFSDSDGTKLIRAVNALQPLGKEKALETLQTYANSAKEYSDDAEVVFWIIRLLFEPVDLSQRIPPPMIAVHLWIGEDDREREQMSKYWPLNPMEVVDGVPFMVGCQIGMGGRPELPSSHIRWAQQFGVIRANPITPTSSPLHAAAKLLESKKFKSLPESGITAPATNIQAQAFSMLGLTNPNTNYHDPLDEKTWQRILQSNADSWRWNESEQAFEKTGNKNNDRK